MSSEQPRIVQEPCEIKKAKLWLAHYHQLHTDEPILPDEIVHKRAKDGKVTFSLKGRLLLHPGLISPPNAFLIRSGRGDKELVIEKKNPRSVVAILSADGHAVHSYDPSYLVRFLMQLHIHEWKNT